MKRQWKIIVIFLVVILLLSWIFPKTALLKITQVKASLQNAPCVTEEQVATDTNFKKGQLFFLQADKIEQDFIKKYPCIDHLTLQQKWPGQIMVTIFGKAPVLKIVGYMPEPLPSLDPLEASASTGTALLSWSIPSTADPAFLVNDQGTLYAVDNGANLPIVYYPDTALQIGKNLDALLIKKLVTIFTKLQTLDDSIPRGRLEDTVLLVQAHEKIAFQLGGSTLSYSDEINRQLASLQLILQKAKIDGKAMDKIDLRFDKPVVVYTSSDKAKDQQTILRRGN